MTQVSTSAIRTVTVEQIPFGAGALYRNLGAVGQELIGATTDGGEFNVERQERDVPVDGAHDAVKELVRPLGESATLTINFPEITEQTILDALRGTKTTQGGRSEIVPSGSISESDYYTNIGLVAEFWDETKTEQFILRLLNPLVRDDWSVTTEDLDAGGIQLTFRGHRAIDDLSTPAYAYGLLAALHRDWDPAEDGSGQTLTERINGEDGTLGSSTGSDSNDPTWVTGPAALDYDADDYVTVSSTPWE